MASQPLTSDQLEEIREAFKLFDTDDSGTIDSDGEHTQQSYCRKMYLLVTDIACRELIVCLWCVVFFFMHPNTEMTRRTQSGNARDGL